MLHKMSSCGALTMSCRGTSIQEDRFGRTLDVISNQPKKISATLRRTLSSPNLSGKTHSSVSFDSLNAYTARKFEETTIPLPYTESASTSIANNGEFVRVFRVEGKCNERLHIDPSGRVEVPKISTCKSDTSSESERLLYLNFGNEGRAQRFYKQRLNQFSDNTFAIKSFDVPKSFLDELRTIAVPEHKRSSNKENPVIADPRKSDPKKGPDQFGLPPKQIKRLREMIIPWSGHKETKLPQ